jgi:tetratricopeptide (TPR) repeat protein
MTRDRSSSLTQEVLRLIEGGNYHRALDLLDPTLKNDAVAAELQWLAASIYTRLGDLASAGQECSKVLQSKSASNLLKARCYYNIAVIHARQGDFESATRNYELMRSPAFGDKYVTNSLYGIADIYHLQGRFSEAASLLRQIIELDSKTNDKGTEARMRRNRRSLALVLSLDGHPQEGLNILDSIQQPDSEPMGLAFQHYYRMAILCCTAQSEVIQEAARHGDRAIQLVEQHNLEFVGNEIYAIAAQVFLELCDYEKAERLAIRAYRLSEHLGDKFTSAHIKLVFADLAELKGDAQQAARNRAWAEKSLSALGADWMYRKHEERKKTMRVLS